jgi:L-amino acid N-acyltransferase YncA
MNPSVPHSLGEDLRLETAADGGLAAAALWWTAAPELAGERVGVIGQYSATSAAASHSLLARATDTLRAQGCTLAVGPMDGNTWRRYRLVTDAGTEPPFFLEPSNPPEWPGWWRAAGFAPLAEYYSAACDDLAARDERLAAVAQRMAAAGVRIRALEPADFAAELRRIYEVSLVSFRANYLYTPLPLEAFVAQYRAIEARVRPELVLLAEREGAPVGYVFATPDYAQAQRGEAPSTVVVKTLAVLPGRMYAGLGALLLGEVQEAARRLGYRRAIHALMHETNKSLHLSSHYARVIRRYTLFGRRLVS